MKVKIFLPLLVIIPLLTVSIIIMENNSNQEQTLAKINANENKIENVIIDCFKISNNCDYDKDGIVDTLDAFSEDPTEWYDFDFDGIGTNLDPDDDNDGILDINDSYPILISQQLIENNLDRVQKCALMEPGIKRTQCFGDFFEFLIKTDKADNDEILFLAASLNKQDTIYGCHAISHRIGLGAFEENPDFYEIISNVPVGLCREGFVHAVMMGFGKKLRGSDANEALTSLQLGCDKFEETNWASCVHGAGHALILYTNDDLQTSIEYCNIFSNPSQCESGVMMEHSDTSLAKSQSIQNDIDKICPKNLTEIQYKDCNIQLGRSLVIYTNHTMIDGKRYCSYIADEKGEEFCLQGLESEISSIDGQKRVVKIFSIFEN